MFPPLFVFPYHSVLGLRLMSDGAVLSGDKGSPVPTSAADLEGTGENRTQYELVRVQSVGKIVPELPGCHSKVFLFPVGFRSCRRYYSTRHTTMLSKYVSEIILSPDGSRPLFRVTEVGQNDEFSFTAQSPGEAWCGVLQTIEQVHAQLETRTEMSLHSFKQELRQYLPERDR